MEREVKIRGLLIDPTTSSPVVLLKDLHGDSILPIWVGPFEANSIASEIEKKSLQRPMTHDLIKNLIVQMNAVAERVTITELKESTFYALIEIRTGRGQLFLVDARPSDAIALALRSDCPIFIRDIVFELSAVDRLAPAPTLNYGTEEDVDWPSEIQ